MQSLPVVVVTSQIGTDSCISLPKKSYITSFVPESTCFYMAVSRQPKNKSYICNLFLAGWDSPGGVNSGIVMYVDNQSTLPLPPKKSLGYMCNCFIPEASKNPATDVKIVQNSCTLFLA
jgi:hypothetical protein